MIQEAKASCAGKWYLPAGRVEPNENLVEAMKREVLEETGLIVEPKSLVMIEVASFSWFRFVMAGKVTGGTLKTLEDADGESLQAMWVKSVEDLDLRAKDVLPLVERAREYYKRPENAPFHADILPISQPLNKLLLRLVICIKRKTT